MDNNKLIYFIEELQKYIISIALFYTVIATIPQFENSFAIPKLLVIFTLTAALCLSQAFKHFLQMKTVLINTIDILLFIFLFANGISTLFSENKIISFWGLYNNEGSHFLAILCYVSIAFIYIRLSKQTILHSLYYFFAGTTVSSLYAIYQYFERGYRPSGLEGQPIISAGVIALGLILSFIFPWSQIKRTRYRILLQGSVILVHLIALFFLDSSIAWISLIGSIVLFMGIKNHAVIKQLTVEKNMIFIIVIIISLLSAGFILFSKEQFSLEQRVRQLNSVKNMFIYELTQRDSMKNIFIGHGQYMSGFNYFRHKDPDINKTHEWEWRLGRIQNHYLETLFTLGFIGLISWIGLFTKSYKYAWKQKNYLVAISILYLLIWQLFYYYIPTLYLISICLLMIPLVDTKKKIVFSLNPIVMILIYLILSIGTGYMSFNLYAAEKELSRNNFTVAIQKAPFYDEYYRISALTKVNIIENCKKGSDFYCSAVQDAICDIPLLYKDAETQAKKAVELNNLDPDNWHSYGLVLFRKSLENSIRDTNLQNSSLQALENAHRIDPLNPKYVDAIGLIYLDKKEYIQAEQYFIDALRLKPDFVSSQNHLIELYKQTQDESKLQQMQLRIVK